MRSVKGPSSKDAGTPLIDRVREMEVLQGMLGSAADGKGGMVLLEGEAGIGKTKLLNEATKMAIDLGFQILSGICLENMRTPHQPFMGMLGDLLREVDGKEGDEGTHPFLEKLSKDRLDLAPTFKTIRELVRSSAGPSGGYSITRERLSETLELLVKNGWKLVLLVPSGYDPGIVPTGADPEVFTLGQGPMDLDPKRLERIAQTVKDAYTRYQRCAFINLCLDPLLEKNPSRKVSNFISITSALAKESGSLFVNMAPDRAFSESNSLKDSKDMFSSIGRGGAVQLMIEEASTYEAISLLFTGLAMERPILVALEDLHWGDKSTFNLLQYLARVSVSARMLIVGTYRTEWMTNEKGGEEPSFLKDALQRMSREKLFRTLHLQRLDRQGTVQLIESLGIEKPNGGLIDDIHNNTEGNPSFIIERIGHLKAGDEGRPPGKEQPTGGTEEAVARRLGSLEGEAKGLLELCSVLGSGFSLSQMAEVDGRGEEAILDVVDSLIGLKFLKETEAGLSFEQNKVKETIYGMMGKERLRELHLKVARVLGKKESILEVPALSRLAYHYLMGGEHQTALESYMLCAEKSIEAGDLESSNTYLKHVLECLDGLHADQDRSLIRVRALQMLGDVQERLGDLDAALGSFEKAIGISNERSMVASLAASHRRIGDIMLRRFEWDQSIESYLRSLAISKKEESDVDSALAFRGLGRIYCMKGDYSRSMECYLKYIEHPFDRIGPEYVLGLVDISDIYAEMGDFNQSLVYCKLAVKKGEEKGLFPEAALGYAKMAGVLLKLGDVGEARRFSEWALSLVKDQKVSELVQEVFLVYGLTMLEMGDLDTASDAESQIANMLRSSEGNRLFEAKALRLRGLILARKRDFKTSIENMERAVKLFHELQMPFHLALACYDYSLIKFQFMDVEGAHELILRSNGLFKEIKSLYYLNKASSKLREIAFVREGMKR